jgi:hypothetical protein
MGRAQKSRTAQQKNGHDDVKTLSAISSTFMAA